MCDLFLYQHFCSNGHSEDDIAIIAYRRSFFRECMNLVSKRLQSEEYWYRELATIYDLMIMLRVWAVFQRKA